MNRNALQKVAKQAVSAARRLGAAVGSVQSSAHSKKELIDLRHLRWAEFRKRMKTREESISMAEPKSILEGYQIENVGDDFRRAQRVEQYRISEKALYIPDGLRWKYLPLDGVKQAEESFRVISAGHCVPVREKRPEIDLVTEAGTTVHVSLEKQESMQKILNIIRK